MSEDQQVREDLLSEGSGRGDGLEDCAEKQEGRWDTFKKAMGSPQAGTWVGAVSAAASAVAAFLAAAQASIAMQQTKLASEVPFRQVLFETKLRALDDYRRAVSQYELDIRLGVISLPWPVYNPDELKSRSLSEMAENARFSRSMIEKYQAFVNNSDAAGSHWSQKVRDSMQEAQELAWVNAQCFVYLGAHVTGTPEYWDQTKMKAAEPCANLYSRAPHTAFIMANRQVEKVMRAELRADTKRDTETIIQDTDQNERL